MATPSLFDVTNQIVFVTGAASGLGWAIAEVLAENGAVVTLADMNSAELQQAVHQLTSKGYRAAPAVVDISDSAELHQAIEECVSCYGRLDVVFANAGIAAGPSYTTSPDGQLDAVDFALWDKALKVNLTGTLDTMHAAARHMKRQKSGRIIVTASISGMRASPVSGYGYVAAKAALINLVRHAAVDLAPYNVLVNAISPGFFLTNLAGGRMKRNPELAQLLAARVPLGRLASPEEIKGAALFLASPASGYVTGANIPVDGGYTAR